MNTLKFGVYDAVTIFNDGHIVKWMLFMETGLRSGKYLTNMMKALDRRPVPKTKTGQQELEKKIRIHRHLLKRRLKDNFEEEKKTKNHHMVQDSSFFSFLRFPKVSYF